MASKKNYTDAEKVAYYKAKYAAGTKVRGGGTRKAAPARSPAYYNYKSQKLRAKTPRREPGAISGAGRLVGGALGELAVPGVGGLFGSALGGKLGHLVESITGFGDYKLQSNSIMTGMMTPPQVVNSANRGAFLVRHREYIGDVSATSAFTLTSYPLNPGQASTFPWLSGLAQNFEQYRLRGCLFEFLSTSSDALLMSAASSALGTVNMATEYDSLESNFSGKREMLNHEFACSRKPSVSFIHPVECKKSRTPVAELYVRTGPVPAGADQRLYDLGKFQIATEGMQASTGVCGELWVTYEVELMKQKYDPGTVSAGLVDHFQLQGVTNLLTLGTLTTPVSSSTLGGRITSATRSYAFPPAMAEGKFIVALLFNGTAAVITAASIAYTNCVGLQYQSGDTTSSQWSPVTGVTSTQWIMYSTVSITGAGASFAYSTGAFPTSLLGADLWVIQMDPAIVSSTLPSEITTLLEEEQSTDDDEYLKSLESEVKRLRLLERKDSKSQLTPNPTTITIHK